MKQDWPTAITWPLLQLVGPVPNANGAVTDTAGLFNVGEAAGLLVRVTLVRVLEVPTACGAKATELGLRVTALVPVPVIPTICGLLGWLSSMTSPPDPSPSPPPQRARGDL